VSRGKGEQARAKEKKEKKKRKREAMPREKGRRRQQSLRKESERQNFDPDHLASFSFSRCKGRALSLFFLSLAVTQIRVDALNQNK